MKLEETQNGSLTEMPAREDKQITAGGLASETKDMYAKYISIEAQNSHLFVLSAKSHLVPRLCWTSSTIYLNVRRKCIKETKNWTWNILKVTIYKDQYSSDWEILIWQHFYWIGSKLLMRYILNNIG